jgi:PHD/YefM family antitoxin component YafN of YafNO toxin-antitoxin module
MIARVRGEDEAAYIIGADEYAATMEDMESEVMTDGTVGKAEEKPAAGNDRDAGDESGTDAAGSKD